MSAGPKGNRVPFELLLCLLVVKNYKYKWKEVDIAASKQYVLLCNHTSKTNHNHDQIGHVLPV